MNIDLNADAGESFYEHRIGNDEKIIPLVSSVNLACGFHGGDPLTMARAIEIAIQNQVKIGAHPSFYDLENFGRMDQDISPDLLEAQILYQLSALAGMLKARGETLHHVKLHGALYHHVNQNQRSAEAALDAINTMRLTINSEVIVVGMAQSSFLKIAKMRGFHVAHEAFIDRRYHSDGSLAPRSEKGSMIEDADECLTQALQIVMNKKADTLCVHGDHAHSVEVARKVREGLEIAGCKILPFI